MFFAASTGVDLLRARRLLDLSLRQVSAELGVPHTTLARWERDPRPLSLQRLRNWSEALERADMTRQTAIRRATTARRYHRRERQES